MIVFFVPAPPSPLPPLAHTVPRTKIHEQDPEPRRKAGNVFTPESWSFDP